MSVLQASDITEAMEVFRQRCRALDVTLEPFVNTMLKPLLQRIIEQEKALEDRDNRGEIAYSDHTDYGSTGTKNYVDYTVTQNIGKKECCEQEEEQ